MIFFFARYLAATADGPAEARDIVKIVRDYAHHAERVAAAGASLDCGPEVLAAAQRAQSAPAMGAATATAAAAAAAPPPPPSAKRIGGKKRSGKQT
jgi:hypothetical protein